MPPDESSIFLVVIVAAVVTLTPTAAVVATVGTVEQQATAFVHDQVGVAIGYALTVTVEIGCQHIAPTAITDAF
jgi:uncharacterized membrane protein